MPLKDIYIFDPAVMTELDFGVYMATEILITNRYICTVGRYKDRFVMMSCNMEKVS